MLEVWAEAYLSLRRKDHRQRSGEGARNSGLECEYSQVGNMTSLCKEWVDFLHKDRWSEMETVWFTPVNGLLENNFLSLARS